MGEQEAREVVDREAQLGAVGALLTARTVAGRADAGIVDQQLQPIGLLRHRLGEPPHLGERPEVGPQEGGLAAGALDLAHERIAALLAAAMGQQPPALRAETLGDDAADAVGRTGDQRRLHGIDLTSRTMSMSLASMPNQSR